VALPAYTGAPERGPASVVAEAPAMYVAARFAPPASEVRGALELPDATVAQLIAATNAGRHVVLMGLPGTGKTTLAIGLARAAQVAGLTKGYLLATATGDWTTFDTIGGLVPSADGALRFAEGVVLRALREDRWLILDELNRADIDRAFGPLLTVLAGAAVDLPAAGVEGRSLRIEPGHEGSGLSADGAVYRVGRHWRIVGTMNTLDRAALFSFSLAFARRFAFVLVPAPDVTSTVALVRARVALDEAGLAFVERLLQASPRPLGPAIILDAARYIAERSGPLARAEAAGSLILPQYEGLDVATVTAFVEALAPSLGPDGAAVLRSYVAAWYGEV
jgi:MoxR-like ATPase